MSRDEKPPEGRFVSDLRDTVSKRVSENEGSIRDKLGRAARWVDQRTGGKYSDQIGRAEAKVGEGVGRLAAQDRTRAARPGDEPGAGSDTPTPPEGTRAPGGGPGGAPRAPGSRTTPPGVARADAGRDESPTGPIGPTPGGGGGAGAAGPPAGGEPAAPGTAAGSGATEPRSEPGREGTDRLRPPPSDGV